MKLPSSLPQNTVIRITRFDSKLEHDPFYYEISWVHSKRKWQAAAYDEGVILPIAKPRSLFPTMAKAERWCQTHLNRRLGQLRRRQKVG